MVGTFINLPSSMLTARVMQDIILQLNSLWIRLSKFPPLLSWSQYLPNSCRGALNPHCMCSLMKSHQTCLPPPLLMFQCRDRDCNHFYRNGILRRAQRDTQFVGNNSDRRSPISAEFITGRSDATLWEDETEEMWMQGENWSSETFQEQRVS